MNFLDKLPKPIFILAPMDDVTDTVFRQIVADLAPPDMYVTEFVNVDGLQSPGREKLLKKLRFTDKERPIFAQLWGLNPENFYKTIKELKDGTITDEIERLRTKDGANHGSATLSYAGVDLNMGCPVRTVIKNGACAALINNRELTGEIIDASREAAGDSFPISIKTRVGFSTTDMSWIEFLLTKKLDLLSIHGRTAKQKSEVAADWGLIGQAREMRDAMFPALAEPQSLRLDEAQGAGEQRTELYRNNGTAKEQTQPATQRFAKSGGGAAGSASRQAGAVQVLRTLIVGNGDIMSRTQGLELAKKYRLDGVMVGRGVFHDPFIFSSPPAGGSPWATYTKEQKIALYRKHVELFAKTWKNGERRVETLNKFCKVYISGFGGAKELREQLMAAKSTDELLSLL